MKRFWIDEIWSSPLTMTMTTTTTSGKRKKKSSDGIITVPLTFVFFLMLIQIVPSACTVDEKCQPRVLQSCDENEICVIGKKGEDSVCKCREGFIENPETKGCEKPQPPPEPSNSHLALGLGLALTFFLLFVVITLVALHYKFGLLAGMCDRLPRMRLFGSSGREFNMVDNEDDDVNPIV